MRIGSRWTLCLILLCLIRGEGSASTRYHVRVSPPNAAGLTATLAFELTSGDTNTNSVMILDFAHDGKAGPATNDGGPIFGSLLDGANPADTTTIEDFGFYAQLAVPFDSLGSQITFTVDVTEVGSTRQGLPPDQLAFFLLRSSDLTPYSTADDLGADALFAIDVTGQAGGDLSVFSPMTFLPPDTLALEEAIVGVPEGTGMLGRLRFRGVVPNPSSGRVRLVYEVPEPGGLLRIRVYDVTGRLVAEPFQGKRGAGTWDTQWDGSDSRGRAVPAGVYIVQLQMAGQSLVRRVVLAR